jgi:hypothetical protein
MSKGAKAIKHPYRWKLAGPLCALLAMTLGASAVCSHAQEEPPLPPAATVDGGALQTNPPLAVDTARATVRGVVRNIQTGAGVARALVRIEGDAATGVLTDGEGRFEIADVPVGPQAMTVTRPGYLDRPFGGMAMELADAGLGQEGSEGGIHHNILVAEGMPEVVFHMAQTCALHGRVLLASGEPASGVTVELVKRTIQEGRAVWQLRGQAKTRSDGGFRFAGLPEGQYTVFTDPEMEDPAEDDASGGSNAQPAAASAPGYAAVYYPDARQPDGVGRIRLAAGNDAQVTLTLTAETFHRVTVTVANGVGAREATSYSASLMDDAGRSLPYAARYDAAKHAVEAMLPDGSYQMLVTSVPQLQPPGAHGRDDTGPYVGVVEFTVAGKPLIGLRAAVGPQIPGPVQVSVLRSALRQAGDTRNGGLVVLANPANGWIDDGIASAVASGSPEGPLNATYTLPGAYWIHAQFGLRGFCESSFTAGGASLAREPLRVGLGGTTAPLTLTLREDCARLTLRLPDTSMLLLPGEEPFYMAYVVPDFDFTGDPEEVVLRPTSGDSISLDNLTPGSYHVYVFAGLHLLEYRNREALAALHSQAVTLEPGGASELVVEVPKP